MYDITKTGMLLATAVFAAVAAVFVGGANARIPNEEGEVIRAQPAAAVAATVDPLAASRLTGLLSSLSPQELSYLKSMTAVCSAVGCQPDEWLVARLGFATRAGSAPTHEFPPGYRGLP